MAILTGDIKLVASQVMADVPEGGGAPTATVIPDGASNAVFPDISEAARAGGRVNLRKLHVTVQTPDTAVYMDCNVIVAEPPADPNVSVTLFSTKSVFDQRTGAVDRIESYLTRGPMWPGILYENHVKGQRSMQLLQRPGTAMPPVGRTLCLVQYEGLANEVSQYVRSIRVTSEIRQAYDRNTDKEFPVMVVTCELSDMLRYDFKGSGATKEFAAAVGATSVRDTTVADAGQYFGVTPLVTALAIGDTTARVASVYTQLVPSARTESFALDQMPAAERTLVLATSPRRVEVANVPHSMRIKIGQENRGNVYVQMLKPIPAPGTIIVSYRALGEWYTIDDDGAGVLFGAGTGVVNYLTGSMAVTLPVLPDDGSSIIFSWGEKSSFVNRSGQAGFRAPEYTFQLEHPGIVKGSLVITWTSGNIVKTATDSLGRLQGSAVGEVNYAQGVVFIRPLFMLDPGGEFDIDYQFCATTTQDFPGLAPDAGGFALINLAESPAPGSITVRWITVRNVSASSGAMASGGASTKTSSSMGSSMSASTSPPVMVAVQYPDPVPAATPIPAPPAALTRVSAVTGGGSGNVWREPSSGMFEMGTNPAGYPVFVAVSATNGGSSGWEYQVPSGGGLAWTTEQIAAGSRVVNGVTYPIWGR